LTGREGTDEDPAAGFEAERAAERLSDDDERVVDLGGLGIKRALRLSGG
jgi:hypothetical protein